MPDVQTLPYNPAWPGLICVNWTSSEEVVDVDDDPTWLEQTAPGVVEWTV
jgi:hypothetical protein